MYGYYIYTKPAYEQKEITSFGSLSARVKPVTRVTSRSGARAQPVATGLLCSYYVES